MDINGIMRNKITKKSTIRDVMQVLGTDLLRQGFNNNIHIAMTLGTMKENKNYIITDTRFKNELKAVKDRGGITIRVDRPRIVGIRFILKDGAYKDEIIKEHESETSLDNATFDYYINNNGSLEELIEEVVKIYQDVKKNKLL